MNITKQFNSTPITFNDEGWFNATEAAKGFGKEPYSWLNQRDSAEYIAALANARGNSCFLQEFNEIKDLDGQSAKSRARLLDLCKRTGLVKTKAGGSVAGGGTWLHPKLAVAFARWLDVRFAVWCDAQIDAIIRGGQSIKAERASLRVEYRPMTDALVRSRQEAGKDIKPHHYSNEADLINRIALGYSAAAFRAHHEIGPEASLRDYLTPLQVRCLTDLQRANTVYLDDGLSFDDRKAKLTSLYQRRHCAALTEEQLRINA